MGHYGKQRAKELQERATKNSGGGKYVKLQDDGDELRCAFLGECYSTYEVWNDSLNRSEEYDEEKHGPEKQARPSLNVTWNIWDMDTKAVRVFRQRTRFFSLWLETTEELENEAGVKWWYKIKRKGKRGDTNTTYTLTPVRQMNDEEQQEMAGLTLFNLEEEASGNRSNSNNSNSAQTEMKTTSGVKAERLNELIGLAKTVHQKRADFLETFLKEFQIERIRDVPQGRIDEAFDFIKGFGAAETKQTAATNDPFAV